MSEEIRKIEQQLYELTNRLHVLRRDVEGKEVPNYTFETLTGKTSLLDLFGDKDKLLVIHNMGQGCRYCTLWADGFNGFVPHLESAMALVLVSKDEPEVQRRFANSRGWRFNLASHGGGPYIEEQTVMEGSGNYPGAVVYRKDGESIRRISAAVFGPGDLYCSIWNLLGLAGMGEADWTPQYRYWTGAPKMEDGAENLNE